MRSLTARSALRHLCAGYLAAQPQSLVFSVTAAGKPSLAGAHASSSLFFNLSHSGRHVLLAFSNAAEVGVDVEVVSSIPDLDALIASVTDPNEAAGLVHEKEPDTRVRQFYSLWTAKEAVLKAAGTGLGVDPKAARFEARGDLWAFLGFQGAPSLGRWTVLPVDPGNDARAHVAINAAQQEMNLFRLTG